MAQKRMFDKAIVDTDRFMDMQMSTKALYFLLGMEADDEGFVSHKKVMRIHGGQPDDLKVLIVKKFIIEFPSGVSVITDWNKNNWLDNRRIKETEYQNEKKQLLLTDTRQYVLSNGSASIEERRGEENTFSHEKDVAIPKLKDKVTEEVEVDDDVEFVETDEDGNPLSKKKNIGKDKEFKRLCQELSTTFMSKCVEYTGKPTVVTNSYFIVKGAMKRHNLKWRDLFAVLDDWFEDRKRRDDEKMNFSWMLSTPHLNRWKAENK